MTLTPGMVSELRNNFREVNTYNHYGFIAKGVRINSEGLLATDTSAYTGARSGNLHLKPLKSKELLTIPAARFMNALILHKAYQEIVPRPVALLYEGSMMETLTNLEAKALYVSEFVEGRRLLNKFPELNKEGRVDFFSRLKYCLGEFREQSIYLMDFAPKDIILPEGDVASLVFADTKQVKTAGDPYNEPLLEEQVKAYRNDYHEFLTPEELAAYEKVLFSQLTDGN